MHKDQQKQISIGGLGRNGNSLASFITVGVPVFVIIFDIIFPAGK
jgi:hypothetical protein